MKRQLIQLLITSAYSIAFFINPNSALAYVEYSAFKKAPKDLIESKDDIVVKNLPRTYSQDAFGNCYAMSSGYILDATNCRTKGTSDCSKIPDTESFSRIDLARYGNEIPKEAKYKSYFKGIHDGGSSNAIIANIYAANMGATSQNCASLEKLLTHFNDPDDLKRAQTKSWTTLQDAYSKFKEEKAKCPTCQTDISASAKSEILENFNITRTNQEILAAFGQDTYEKFLDKLLIPKECHDRQVYLSSPEKLEMILFPADARTISNYDENIKAIKGALNKQAPIAVNGVCLGNDFDPKKVREKYLALLNQGGSVKTMSISSPDKSKQYCSEPHSVVISGYRKICKDSKKEETCRETLKIQNSWGETWQQENNDGWVDARAFLDRTAYLGQNLTWLEDKNPTR